MKNIATNYDYLNGLSKKTRKFIISRIENGATVGGGDCKKEFVSFSNGKYEYAG